MTPILRSISAGCAAVLCVSVAFAADEIAFEKIDGAKTGAKEILDKRKAEILERKGGKMGSHDWWIWALTNIDYDNDGDQDLIVSIHGPSNGVVIRNNLRETGKLTFTDVTKELGADGIMPAADWNPIIWDFDGDGFLDIAGLFDDVPTSSVINEGGKKFSKASFNFHPLNKGPTITDLNGDGHPDCYYAKRQQEIFMYDPSGKTFKKEFKPNPPPEGIEDATKQELEKILADKTGARFFAARFYTDYDLNSDGVKDVVIAGHSGYNGPCIGRFLAGGADGKFTLKNKEWGLPDEGTPLLIADLNDDGAMDVLTVAGKEAGLYLNDGKGKFALKAGPLTDFVKKRENYLQRVFRVDLNNDGRLEVIVSNRRGGAVQAFQNNSGGEFKQVLSARGWDADPVVINDIDNDGLIDIVVGGPGEDIVVYRNQTANAGQWTKILPRMAAPNPFAVDAVVEIFSAGDGEKKDARPLHKERAHADATPVHAGLGAAKNFDLRVSFPGKEPKVVEFKNVDANKTFKVTPEGALEEVK